MIPGGPPVLRRTAQESRLLALVTTRIFLRLVMWCVLIKMRYTDAISKRKVVALLTFSIDDISRDLAVGRVDHVILLRSHDLHPI